MAENTPGWGVPVYVGAGAPLIRYIYKDNYVLKMRTETDGVLSAARPVADYLDAQEYSGVPLAYFTDAVGGLHMVVSGQKDGLADFYYAKPD